MFRQMNSLELTHAVEKTTDEEYKSLVKGEIERRQRKADRVKRRTN